MLILYPYVNNCGFSRKKSAVGLFGRAIAPYLYLLQGVLLKCRLIRISHWKLKADGDPHFYMDVLASMAARNPFGCIIDQSYGFLICPAAYTAKYLRLR